MSRERSNYDYADEHTAPSDLNLLGYYRQPEVSGLRSLARSPKPFLIRSLKKQNQVRLVAGFY